MIGFLNDLEVNHNLQNCKNFRQPGRTNCVKIEESMAGSDVVCSASVRHSYMVIQGELLWAVICYPSCAFMVSYCSRFMQNPQERHFAMQKQTMCYMIKIKDKGITYRRVGPPEILVKGYAMDSLNGGADATWGDCHKSSKATTGYHWSTDIGLICFYSGKQCNVCSSTCESEVMSSRTCCMHGMTLRGIYEDIGFTFTKPLAVKQDNTGAIALCTSDAHHKRSRHFRVASHYLKELYERGICRFVWTSSRCMEDDIFTKPLDESTNTRHENTLTRNL
jgi:hypothetical protein